MQCIGHEKNSNITGPIRGQLTKVGRFVYQHGVKDENNYLRDRLVPKEYYCSAALGGSTRTDHSTALTLEKKVRFRVNLPFNSQGHIGTGSEYGQSVIWALRHIYYRSKSYIKGLTGNYHHKGSLCLNGINLFLCK